MILEDLGYKGKKLEKLNSNGISTVAELLYKQPRKYLFFDKPHSIDFSDEVISASDNKTAIVFTGIVSSVVLDSVKGSNATAIKIKVKNPANNILLYVNIFGEFRMFEAYKSSEGQKIYVGGVPKIVTFDNGKRILTMSAPSLYTSEEDDLRIYPVYRKHKGISDEFYKNSIKAAEETIIYDYMPQSLVGRFKLPNYKEAVQGIHYPLSQDEIEYSRQRIIFDDILYFTSKIAQNATGNLPTVTLLNKRDTLDSFIRSLPYTLTSDQENAINSLSEKMKYNQTKALVQGDVSCGKTIVAMSLMIHMAENGYQSVLVAPTTILAKQHFEELKEYADRFGFKTVLLCSDASTKERNSVLKAIADKEALLIVGTHSLFSDDVRYNSLGLVITDEEHKFGVLQRESIQTKINAGIHTITMSATPIPRTIAASIYGDNTEIITITQMPGGRKKTKTAITCDDKAVFEFIEKEVSQGSQAYVVCPLIDEAEEDSTMSGIASVEDVYKRYNAYFAPRGYKIGVITGKSSADELKKIKDAFVNNKIQILIATTVIEVGVNVPNATVMAIISAERFGLATLHQLRGRVGRGTKQSYCILQKSSPEIDSSNLEILQNETNGFEIARADLKNRGSGNILGTAQSGSNKFISLLIEYPMLYDKVKQIAKNLPVRERDAYIRMYEELYPSCL